MVSIQHIISVRQIDPPSLHLLNADLACTAFILAGFLQGLGRILRKNVRPCVLPPDYPLLEGSRKTTAEHTTIKKIYDFLCVIGVHATLNFAIIPFIVLDLRPSMEVWKVLHYYGLIMTFIPLLAFRFGLQGKCKGALQARAQEAGVTEEAVTKLRSQAKRHHEKGVSFIPDAPGAVEKEIKHQQKHR
jgi:lysophospholipid acyltransferase